MNAKVLIPFPAQPFAALPAFLPETGMRTFAFTAQLKKSTEQFQSLTAKPGKCPQNRMLLSSREEEETDAINCANRGGPPERCQIQRTGYHGRPRPLVANAAKHGLSGHKLMVLEGESPEEWQALVDDCVGEFSPESNMEWELVVEIAAARWRLRRSKFVETAMIDMEIGKRRTQIDDTYAAPDHPLSHATAMMALGSNMTLLDRYETRATRAYDRAVRNFDSLRARRKSAAAEKSFLPNEPEPRLQCI